jgi:hypothetical protein
MTSPNPYAPPNAPLAEQPEAVSQAIWNPNAAAGWSLFLTPVFGPMIHMLNWRVLGEPERAAIAKGWVVGGVVMLTLFLAPVSEELDRLFRLVGTVYYFGWYFSAGRTQVRYVRNRLGTSYRRRPWSKALLLGLLGLLAYAVLASVLLWIAEPGQSR